MDTVLYYIRDNLVGTHYFIYSFILLVLMFAIIGYLLKQKYGKLDIRLDVKSGLNQDEKKVKIESNEPITIPNQEGQAVNQKLNN